MDISYENVMLIPETDTLKVIDFGLAMPTNGDGGPPRHGHRGKPLFAAPEVRVAAKWAAALVSPFAD